MPGSNRRRNDCWRDDSISCHGRLANHFLLDHAAHPDIGLPVRLGVVAGLALGDPSDPIVQVELVDQLRHVTDPRPVVLQ